MSGFEPASLRHERNDLTVLIYTCKTTSEIFIEPSSPNWNPNGKSFLENATASEQGRFKDPGEIVCRLYTSWLQFLFRVLMCDS